MRPRERSRKGFDLQLIFGSAAPPTVVSESSLLLEFAVSCGFRALSIDQVLAYPPPALRGIESHLEFQMSSSSRLNFRRQPQVSNGQLVPIGEYLEAEIEGPL